MHPASLRHLMTAGTRQPVAGADGMTAPRVPRRGPSPGPRGDGRRGRPRPGPAPSGPQTSRPPS